MAVNFVTWYKTKDRIELTCQLDGYISIGSILESDLSDLKLIYNNNPVKNALKVSWRIINTGSRGISEFEKKPMLIYPERFNIVKANVSETSPLLNIDKNVRMDPIHKRIEIDNLGILNPKDFFKVDVYMIDVPDSNVSQDYFNDWIFMAKALNLKTQMKTKFEQSTWLHIDDNILQLIMGITGAVASLTGVFIAGISFIKSKKS